jgi:hypothetical protein
VLDVLARHELGTWITISDAADLDGRDMLPLLGEVLGETLVVSEGDRDMHLVGFGVAIRRAEIGERVVGGRLGLAREHADDAGHCRLSCSTMTEDQGEALEIELSDALARTLDEIKD